MDRQKNLSDEKLKGFFDYFSLSKGGFITFDDLKDIFERHRVEKTDLEINMMLNELVLEEAGKINF